MPLMVPGPDPLACSACGGYGERAVPDRFGRVTPWARTAICECNGTGRAPCGCCGAPGAAHHLDAHGFPIGECCDPVVELELASDAPGVEEAA